MGRSLPDSVILWQPHPVRDRAYRFRMTADPKKVLASNIRRLLRLGNESGVSKLIKLGISNGNAQRALKGETAIGLDVLAQLAAKLGVQPWQLLVEDLDPDELPTLRQQEFRWPFKQIDFESVASLVGTKAADVERGLSLVLAGAGVPARKLTGTDG